MFRTLALLLSALLLGTPSAEAVIVASGNGTQNTTAPADDPGWANVGTRGGLSVVYVGNRWVVTAAHVGIGTVTFGGVDYEAIPGSAVTFETSPGQRADLIAFKLREDPGLPPLVIASATPPIGAPVVMIGHGRDRGAATQWSGIGGWLWGPGASMRWGTNLVASAPANVTIGSVVSRAFTTDFTPAASTAQEAQAAEGDSGGALFVQSGAAWRLAGVLFAIASFVDQPASSALYGNLTYAIDLAFYRSALLAVTTRPACSDGLDDDGDGLADYPADPGCRDAAWTLENPHCDDDLDNDGDGGIDWDGGAAHGRPDSRCGPNRRWMNAEAAGCGLGAELAAVIPLLARWRRRRRAAWQPRAR